MKEFEALPSAPGYGGFDPYSPIREKINQATRQFKEYKEFPCSLVLANPRMAFVRLNDPSTILGAMLGNLGYSIPMEATRENSSYHEDVFLGRGKMINYKKMEAQNTTISSVVVLEQFPLRSKQIQFAIPKKQLDLGRKTLAEENWAISEFDY